MCPVGSPSPNIRSLWTSWDTDVQYMAKERTEDRGMQLENKPVVFVKSDDYNGFQDGLVSICGVVRDLYGTSIGVNLTRCILGSLEGKEHCDSICPWVGVYVEIVS